METIVYTRVEPILPRYSEYDSQAFPAQSGQADAVRPKKGARAAKAAKVFLGLGVFLLFLPMLATNVIGSVSSSISSWGTKNIYDLAVQQPQQGLEAAAPLPPIDESLPVEPRIAIQAMGVDTQIRQYSFDRHEEALKLGAWMPTNFGTPGSEAPVIIAAHRFGYLNWSNQFRRENSFYNMPKLEEGDRVEIIWHQRKFVYKVYAIETGTEITDYDADLILFTCNDLVSDLRIVAYAKQI